MSDKNAKQVYLAPAETGWSGRSVWIVPVTIEEDGTPIFGKPQKEVQFPIALK